MTAEHVATFSDSNFNQEVLGAAEPVLVDFWAPWCGPCRAIGPVVDRLAGEYLGRVKVGKVNVDEQARLSERYEVQSIPTLLIFKQGRVLERIVGAVPAARLNQALLSASQR